MAKILLVEDDQWIADCYAKWLTTDNHYVSVSGDAQTAIDSIDDQPPELIILDLLLPQANGIQLLHTLQSYGDISSIPVMVCSSSLPDDMPEVYGVRRVLLKSELTPARLRQEVKQVLNYAAV